MASFGGYGKEVLGAGPYGAGGLLHVLRAAAISGRTVRVVFDEAPLHVSQTGLADSLSPSNYQFSIVTGQADAPLPIRVKQGLIVGPTLLVRSGDERGVDVQLDRTTVIGVGYRVTALNIRAAAGGELGSPLAADFGGRVPLPQTRVGVRGASNVDFKNSISRGVWEIDDSGDMVNEGGNASLKKRVLRRAITQPNAFSWLVGYGTRTQLKAPFSISEVAQAKASLQEQILQEPEVAEAMVQTTIQAGKVVTHQIQVRTLHGAVVEVGSVIQQPDGRIVIG